MKAKSGKPAARAAAKAQAAAGKARQPALSRAPLPKGKGNAVKQKAGPSNAGRAREEPKKVSKSQPTKTAPKLAVRTVVTESPEIKLQTERFNRAMELFHARELKKARELFEKASDGPNREMAFSAKTHQRMCEQRLERQAVKLDAPEDYYNYGVALTNQGQLPEAKKNLEQALKLRNADHYHYALALCLGLMGDMNGAAGHLAQAIELQPNNRIAARNDPDFAELLHHPALHSLLRGV